MRVRIYFRRQGAEFRDLGDREMGSVPAENDTVLIKFEGEAIQARVCRVRAFLSRAHQPDRDPEVYLEST
jgi:hypothetical protein